LKQQQRGATLNQTEQGTRRIEELDPNYEWLYLKDAWRRLPKGTDVSLTTFRKWVKEGRHGIIGGVFGGLIMVRADTIPTVTLFN